MKIDSSLTTSYTSPASKITNSERIVFHIDALGSTRVTTDEEKAVLAAAIYDAYGNTQANFDSGESTGFLAAYGAKTDETGLIYAKGNYYDPSTASKPGFLGNLRGLPGRIKDNIKNKLKEPFIDAKNKGDNTARRYGDLFNCGTKKAGSCGVNNTGAANALQHCVASCEATSARGPLLGYLSGIWHEISRSREKNIPLDVWFESPDTQMDLENNKQGINAGYHPFFPNDYPSCWVACKEKLDNGELTIINPDCQHW